MSALTLGVSPEAKRDVASNGKSRRRIRNSLAYKRAADDFRAFLNAIQHWVSDYAARVFKVYLVVEPEVINLYAIAQSQEYDFELRAALSELVLSLRTDGISVRGSLVPNGEPEELKAFFDPESALVLSTQ